MIHVCYAFTDKNGSYSKFVGTSIQSLFENSCEGICVHLIHDSTLTEDNRKKFLQLPINGNQMILFYNLETLKPDIIEYLTKRTTDDNQKRFTFGMYYRFMMPDVIPPEISKAIYLDGDTVVNIDIKTLWDIDLKDCPLGAAAEVEMGVGIEKQSLVTHKNFPSVKKGWIKAENYFNSGIMSFNLDALRRFKAQNSENGKSFLESIMEYCEKRFNKNMSDQAILNCTFSDHYIHIPPIYNKPVDFYCERKYPLSPGICHFISYKKISESIQMINTTDYFSNIFSERHGEFHRQRFLSISIKTRCKI